MCKNIGNLDKTVRIIIGIVIIVAGFYYESWWGLIGLIPLFTALSGHCPCYKACKMNTCGSSGNCCEPKDEMSDGHNMKKEGSDDEGMSYNDGANEGENSQERKDV